MNEFRTEYTVDEETGYYNGYPEYRQKFEPTIQPIEEAAQISQKAFENMVANMEPLGAEFQKVFENMVANMEPLGAVFQKVLDDNRWELYERTDKEK
jgi:hypothetical protein